MKMKTKGCGRGRASTKMKEEKNLDRNQTKKTKNKNKKTRGSFDLRVPQECARCMLVHACACMCACAKVACMPRAPGAPVRHAVRDLVRACVRSRGTIVASRGQGTKHHVEGTLFSLEC